MRSRQPAADGKPISVYLSKELREKIEVLSHKEHRSLSAQIVVLLERLLAKSAAESK